MKTAREKLIAARFGMAMKPVPVDLGLVYSATFNWRIRAILEKSRWEETKLPDYYYLDFIDFLTLGKWSANG